MRKAKIKEKISKKDDLILLHSDCDNCGHPLKLNMITKECKCEYCGTEYCIKEENGNYSRLGQLIHITIGGMTRKFYISEISCSHLWDCEPYRDLDGHISFVVPQERMSLRLEEV